MSKASKKDTTLVPFRLSKIQTLEFAFIESSFSKDEEVQVSQAYNFGIDPETYQLGIASRYEFSQKSPFMIIEVRCVFNIEPEGWKTWMNIDEEVLVVPRNVAMHM